MENLFDTLHKKLLEKDKRIAELEEEVKVLSETLDEEHNGNTITLDAYELLD